MRKLYLIIIPVVLCAVLSGCYFPFPTNFEPTKMVATNTVTGFGIVGENLSGFEWYLDGELLTDKTKSIYLYWPRMDDIGMHELTVNFYQKGKSHSYSWDISVSAPPLSSSESETEQQNED
jgi:hypothetical protein